MWSILRTIPKFTPRSRIDRLLGTPGLPLEDRPVYAYGGGFVVTFSPVRFRVEGLRRVEYGEPGEYAVSVLHFSDNAALQTHLNLEHACPGRAAVLEEDLVDGAVSYRSTLAQARRWAARSSPQGWGETWGMAGGKFQLLYHFLQYDPYQFFFYGSAPQTPLTGFQYVLPEENPPGMERSFGFP